jgi:hypothetical protein
VTLAMFIAVALALGFGLLLGWALFRIEAPASTVEIDMSVDFLGLFAELQMYREVKAVSDVGVEARVIGRETSEAALDVAKARLADQLERVLTGLGLDPLNLPYPAAVRLKVETEAYGKEIAAGGSGWTSPAAWIIPAERPKPPADPLHIYGVPCGLGGPVTRSPEYVTCSKCLDWLARFDSSELQALRDRRGTSALAPANAATIGYSAGWQAALAWALREVPNVEVNTRFIVEANVALEHAKTPDPDRG